MSLKTFFSIVPAAILLDRLTKHWAIIALKARPGGTMQWLPGFLGFHYAENTGAAFSAFSSGTVFITVLTAILIIAVLAFLLVNKSAGGLLRSGLWLIVAGGVGNLFDRIVYGYVVDFIEVQFMRFAVFNLADVFICVGAGLALIALFVSPSDGAGKRRAKEG